MASATARRPEPPPAPALTVIMGGPAGTSPDDPPEISAVDVLLAAVGRLAEILRANPGLLDGHIDRGFGAALLLVLQDPEVARCAENGPPSLLVPAGTAERILATPVASEVLRALLEAFDASEAAETGRLQGELETLRQQATTLDARRREALSEIARADADRATLRTLLGALPQLNDLRSRYRKKD